MWKREGRERGERGERKEKREEENREKGEERKEKGEERKEKREKRKENGEKREEKGEKRIEKGEKRIEKGEKRKRRERRERGRLFISVSDRRVCSREGRGGKPRCEIPQGGTSKRRRRDTETRTVCSFSKKLEAREPRQKTKNRVRPDGPYKE